MAERVGFEPTGRSSRPTVFKTARFNRSRTSPHIIIESSIEGASAPYILLPGAGRRTRTPDLLITNQLLYQLSYTGIYFLCIYYTKKFYKSQVRPPASKRLIVSLRAL